MKKSLVALAALAVIGAASAQSSVTMYGAVEPTVDFGYKNTATTSTQTYGPTGVLLTNNATYNQIKGGFRVQDGNDQGTGTSRIGWLGTEDLGGGLKAKFQLEMGIRIDDGCTSDGGSVCSSGGSGGNLFGRNAWLGIEGGLGEVRLGRQVLGSFGVQGKSWAAGSSNGLYEAGAFTTSLMGGVRFSNAIKYISPSMGGFQATVTLAAPEGDTNTTATNVATGVVNTTADTKNKTGFDLALEYANGPLYVGYGFNKTEGTTGTNNGVAGAGNITTIGGTESKQHTLGAAYDFGVVKPFVNYTRTNAQLNATTFNGGIATTTPPGVGVNGFGTGGPFGLGNFGTVANTGPRSGKAKAWTLGVRAPIGAATLIAAYGTEKSNVSGSYLTAGALTATGSGEAKEKQYQIGMQYPLSKRTLLEANYGRYKVDGTMNGTTYAAGAVTGSSAMSFSNKISALNFGIKHSF